MFIILQEEDDLLFFIDLSSRIQSKPMNYIIRIPLHLRNEWYKYKYK